MVDPDWANKIDRPNRFTPAEKAIIFDRIEEALVYLEPARDFGFHVDVTLSLQGVKITVHAIYFSYNGRTPVNARTIDYQSILQSRINPIQLHANEAIRSLESFNA